MANKIYLTTLSLNEFKEILESHHIIVDDQTALFIMQSLLNNIYVLVNDNYAFIVEGYISKMTNISLKNIRSLTKCFII